MHPEAARELRLALNNPERLAKKLGLRIGGGNRRYVLVNCPVHSDRSPSCSIHVRNGTIAVKCHACDWTGDALSLIAVVHGLDTRADFQAVLETAADLAGRRDLVSGDHGLASKPHPVRTRSPQDSFLEETRGYPPIQDVNAFWGLLGAVADDIACCRQLVSRKIDPAAVSSLGLARAIIPRTASDRMPAWAMYRGCWWRDTGHRMVLPAFDCSGVMRSVRAWRVTDSDAPKRLPPAGYMASGIVLANELARRMLSAESSPGRVLVVEGEPDYLVRSISNPECAVVGVISGSWSDDFAARVPYGSEVIVRTHADEAGDRYAAQVMTTLKSRAHVYRMLPFQE